MQKYRDIILHNPVLGRAMNRGRTSFPRQEVLERVKLSWREAERLDPDELIDSHDLFLHGEVTNFLQQKWGIIIGALGGVRDSSRFKRKWALEGILPINTPGYPFNFLTDDDRDIGDTRLLADCKRRPIDGSAN